MLRDRYPPAPWLHMAELVNHVDPFERVNGWTDEKIGELVHDALDLLQQQDKDAFHAYVYSVDISAYHRLLTEGYDIPKPSGVCAHSCIVDSFNWYTNKHGLETAYVFYDRGEVFLPPIREVW
ncbi:MAG: hypothetical protein ABIZ80_11640, partial [Bryobacteraceae bacterium]